MSDPAAEIPEAGRHVWDAFRELDAARNSNGYSALRTTYTEIRSWADLTGTTLASWEVRALRRMDDARVATADAALAPPVEKPSERELSPALFAALFE